MADILAGPHDPLWFPLPRGLAILSSWDSFGGGAGPALLHSSVYKLFALRTLNCLFILMYFF